MSVDRHFGSHKIIIGNHNMPNHLAEDNSLGVFLDGEVKINTTDKNIALSATDGGSISLQTYDSGGIDVRSEFGAINVESVGTVKLHSDTNVWISGGLRIEGGNPQVDKVLTSSNSSGDTYWSSSMSLTGLSISGNLSVSGETQTDYLSLELNSTGDPDQKGFIRFKDIDGDQYSKLVLRNVGLGMNVAESKQAPAAYGEGSIMVHCRQRSSLS